MKLHKQAYLAPVSINDLPAIQGWLQSMAAQGLHLDSCSNATFMFDQKEPVQRRYRIDPSTGTLMGVASPKLQDIYREFGWTYADSYTRHHHVFYTDDPDTAEPFSIPEGLNEKLEKLKRRRIAYHVLSIGTLLLLHILSIILNPSNFHIRDVILFVILIGSAIHDISPLSKTNKSVLVHTRIPDPADSPRRFRIVAGILYVWLMLSLIFK